MTANSSVLQQISDSETQLKEALKNVSPDGALIAGILNFVRSKFLQLILEDIDDSIKIHQEQSHEETAQLAQREKPQEEKTEFLHDKFWNDFYHPTLKYFQAQHQSLKNEESKHRKRIVELRKLNDQFLKITKISNDFFNDILNHILGQYDIRFIIPELFYDFLKVQPSETAIKVDPHDQATKVKLIYLIHRSLLFMGAISRYRTKIASFLPQSYHETYDNALRYCRHAELLLPSFGEPRNYIGMIYDSKGDKFLALNEFSRAATSRIPSKLALTNFKSLLGSSLSIVDELNRLRLNNDCNDERRYHYVTTYFYSLYGYYFATEKWRRSGGVLRNGMKVENLENDFFRILEDSIMIDSSEGRNLLERMAVLLIAGLSINLKEEIDVTKSLRFTFKFITFILQYGIDQWESDFQNVVKLLPVIRIFNTWIKADKLASLSAFRDYDFLAALSRFSNKIYAKYPELKFNHRPTRTQFFDEDVGLREFIPISRMFSDFNDAGIFQDQVNSHLKYIGAYEDHDQDEELDLRLLAIGCIAKQLMVNNKVGIVYDEEKREFNLDAVKLGKKPKQKKAKAPKSQPVSREQTQSPKPKNNNGKNSNANGDSKKSKHTDIQKTETNKKDKNMKNIKKESNTRKNNKSRYEEDEDEEEVPSGNTATVVYSYAKEKEEKERKAKEKASALEVVKIKATSSPPPIVKVIPAPSQSETVNSGTFSVDQLESKISQPSTSTNHDNNFQSMVDQLVGDSSALQSQSSQIPQQAQPYQSMWGNATTAATSAAPSPVPQMNQEQYMKMYAQYYQQFYQQYPQVAAQQHHHHHHHQHQQQSLPQLNYQPQQPLPIPYPNVNMNQNSGAQLQSQPMSQQQSQQYYYQHSSAPQHTNQRRLQGQPQQPQANDYSQYYQQYR